MTATEIVGFLAITALLGLYGLVFLGRGRLAIGAIVGAALLFVSALNGDTDERIGRAVIGGLLGCGCMLLAARLGPTWSREVKRIAAGAAMRWNAVRVALRRITEGRLVAMGLGILIILLGFHIYQTAWVPTRAGHGLTHWRNSLTGEEAFCALAGCFRTTAAESKQLAMEQLVNELRIKLLDTKINELGPLLRRQLKDDEED